MTLTELKYIVSVSTTMHFGKAAKLCNVSQPTLSVAIKKLEEELGVVIFERKNTEIVITPAGKQIIKQAKNVLAEAQRVKEIADVEKDPLDGPLRVGIIFTISPFLLPELIRKTIVRTPQMPLIIVEGYTNGLLEKLKTGEVDALVCALPIYEPGLMCCPLYDENFIVVVPGNHPFTKLKEVQMKDLNSEDMLLLTQGNCFRDQVLEVCPDRYDADPAGIRSLHFAEGSSLQTLRHMVASGLGISVFPESAVNYDLHDSLVKYIKIAPPVPTRRVAILWRKTFQREKAILRLVETCSSINLEGIKHLPADVFQLGKGTN